MRHHLQAVPSLITYVLVILALSLGILWLIPANYYMIFPGQAQQVTSMISVPGHRSVSPQGGLYDTYVNEFRATRLLYVLFGLVRSDVTVEPASLVSSGCPDQQYEEQLMAMMADSKVQAEAAALNALGYKVQFADSGPEVSQISCNVPANKVLRPGDRIIAIDGQPVQTFNQVKSLTEIHPPGSILRLTVKRQGVIKHVAVRTVHADQQDNIIPAGGHAMIGIIMTMPLKFPVRVHINSGGVGGPSAGLAFALGIVEQLSRHDLTHGNKVAVTGTITFERIQGRAGAVSDKAIVGPIGGVRQKALAAQAAGAKYFLVPSANYQEALSAHANLKVIPVQTLRGALDVLKSLPKSQAERTAKG